MSALVERYDFGYAEDSILAQRELEANGPPQLDNLSKVDFLHSEVFRALVKLLRSFPEDCLKFPVTQIAVKILGRVSMKTLRFELPRTLQHVVKLLQSKKEEIREQARKVVVEVTQFLGPLYLGFLVDTLRSNLTKGFMIHVLGLTLYEVLSECVENTTTGSNSSPLSFNILFLSLCTSLLCLKVLVILA